MALNGTDSYSFKSFRLSIADRRLYENGNFIKVLTPLQFEILQILIESSPARFTDKMLVEQLADVSKRERERIIHTETQNIHTAVSQLRVLLRDPQERSEIISSARGKGYRFAAAVEKISNRDEEKSLERNAGIFGADSAEAARRQPPAAIENPASEQDFLIKKSERQQTIGSFLSEAQKPTEVDSHPEENFGETFRSKESETVPESTLTAADERTEVFFSGGFSRAVIVGSGANTFGGWLWHQARSAVWLLIGLVILTMVVTVKPINIDGRDFTMMTVSAAQALVLLIAVLYFSRAEPDEFRSIEDVAAGGRLNQETSRATGYEHLKDWGAAGERAEKVLDRYTIYWQLILIAWFFLYLCLTIKGYPDFSLKYLPQGAKADNHSIIIWLSILSAFLNNCSAWMIFLCFNMLNKPTELKKDQRTISDPALGVGLTIVVLFTLIEILLVLAVANSNQAKYDVLLWASGASGIAGGIIMALYVGRLQSKFLGPSALLIVMLYSYTAIQPLFLYLEGDPTGAVILMNIALSLKCLLFFYMAWLFKSGRLLYYLIRVKRTYENVDQDWASFRQLLKGKS